MTRDERMARVVELRSHGLSLRSIGALIGCSEGTVRGDLRRWEQETITRLLADARTEMRNPQVSEGEGA